MPLNLLNPATVSFTDTSTPSADITFWHWDFGDGTTSDDQAPADKTYAVSGSYTVSLAVASAKGTDIYEDTITVSDQALPGAILYTQWVIDGGTGDYILRTAVADPVDSNHVGYYYEATGGTPVIAEAYKVKAGGTSYLDLRFVLPDVPGTGETYTVTVTSVNTQGLRSRLGVTTVTDGAP
jgi:microbial collagenase